MIFNWLIIATLLMAGVFFRLGQAVARRTTCWLVPILFAIVAVPAVMMALYYLHFFDNSLLFYEFRAAPFSELRAAPVGLLCGWLQRRTAKVNWLRRYLIPLLMVIGLSVPYLKLIYRPLSPQVLKNQWQNGVCIQSTTSTCGPASLATLLKQFGQEADEAEIARKCYASQTGTENWYMVRYLRNRGVKADYVLNDGSSIPIKTGVAGVKLKSGVGHFIAILHKDKDGQLTFADPLYGKETQSGDTIMKQYQFTGFFIDVATPEKPAPTP